MRIISKRGIKDYYDYLQGTYGIDPLVVYDRRECNVIDPPKSHSEDYPLLFCDWFGTNIDCNDKPKERIRNWSSKSEYLRHQLPLRTHCPNVPPMPYPSGYKPSG